MWKCSCCGQVHDDLPFSYGAEAPYTYFAIPVEERETRAILEPELCVIDEEHFFVKAQIRIPVHGEAQPFIWGVWVSLSKANFKRTIDLWETPGRESEAPYFGWLNTELPVYPSTIDLPTAVHTMPVGERPLVVVQDETHPLAQEQQEGIPLSRVQEIAERLLHSAG